MVATGMAEGVVLRVVMMLPAIAARTIAASLQLRFEGVTSRGSSLAMSAQYFIHVMDECRLLDACRGFR